MDYKCNIKFKYPRQWYNAMAKIVTEIVFIDSGLIKSVINNHVWHMYFINRNALEFILSPNSRTLFEQNKDIIIDKKEYQKYLLCYDQLNIDKTNINIKYDQLYSKENQSKKTDYFCIELNTWFSKRLLYQSREKKNFNMVEDFLNDFLRVICEIKLSGVYLENLIYNIEEQIWYQLFYCHYDIESFIRKGILDVRRV